MASNDLDNLTVLGTTVRTPIDHVEVFPAPADVTLVRFTSDEVSSICPVTAQPDVATVVIEYSPDKFCIESKSFGCRNCQRSDDHREASLGEGATHAAPSWWH
jgi:7-cyano-7-deazaguanine reductase